MLTVFDTKLENEKATVTLNGLAKGQCVKVYLTDKDANEALECECLAEGDTLTLELCVSEEQLRYIEVV